MSELTINQVEEAEFDLIAALAAAWRDAYDMQMRTAVRPLQQAAD